MQHPDDSPDLPAPPEATTQALQRWWAELADREAEALAEGLDLLEAQRAAAFELQPTRMAAAPDVRSPRPGSLPALRLLLAPGWGAAIEPEGLVFLQGRDEELYLRLQVGQAPEELHLAVESAEGPRGFALPCERLPDGARVFALEILNGGGEAGSLWYCPDADAGDVLGPAARRLTLHARAGGSPSFVTLGSLAIPDIDPRARMGFDDPDGQEPPTSNRVRELIRAYTRGEPRGFAAALTSLVTHGSGHNERARADRSWWRRLSRWQALWVRAMLAELRERRLWDPYGCGRASGHPQLGVGPQAGR